MYDMSGFIEYLDYTNEGDVPTSELGLVSNAPQSAIDAYEEYKKSEKERVARGEDWD